MAGVPRIGPVWVPPTPMSIEEYFNSQRGRPVISAPNFSGQMPQVEPQFDNPTPPTGNGMQPGISAPQYSDEIQPDFNDSGRINAAPFEPAQIAPAGDRTNARGLFSFMDQPGASDAMVGFGAAMLKAPTFMEGLAGGAKAVNDVARENRYPTAQEISWARVMGKMPASKDPDIVELFDEKTGQPYKARYNFQTGGYDRVGGIKAPSGTSLEVGPDGTVSFTQGMNKPLTESQSKNVGYLSRMTEAMPIIDNLGEELQSFTQSVGGQIPYIGNYLKSANYQKAEQAAGQWRQAFLRKDSGATITPEETTDTNQLYIPQPGDKPETVQRKATARQNATKAVQLGLSPQVIMEMEKKGVDLSPLNKQEAPPPVSGTTKSGINFQVQQ